MGKQQIIEQIRQINRSVDEKFLISFGQQTLENYLKRLNLAQCQRGRESVWVRPNDVRAIVVGA